MWLIVWLIFVARLSAYRGQGFSWAAAPIQPQYTGAAPPLPDVVSMVPAGVRNDPLMGAYPGMHAPAPSDGVSMDSAVFVVTAPPPAYSVPPPAYATQPTHTAGGLSLPMVPVTSADLPSVPGNSPSASSSSPGDEEDQSHVSSDGSMTLTRAKVSGYATSGDFFNSQPCAHV